VTGNNGGVHVVDTDVIGLQEGIRLDNSNGKGSNREVFISQVQPPLPLQPLPQQPRARKLLSAALCSAAPHDSTFTRWCLTDSTFTRWCLTKD
jgi:hypothetical protein